MNVVVEKVYKRGKASFTSFNRDDFSLDELFRDVDINTHYYMTCLYKDEEIDVDLSLLVTDTSIGKCQTFLEVQDNLTEELLFGYRVELDIKDSGGLKRSLQSFSLFSEQGISIHYADRRTPEDRDIPQFKRRYRDLILTDEDGEKRVENYLVSVNGLLTVPMRFKGELFLRNGAKYLYSNDKTDTPGLVVLDTKNLGGYEIVNFSECEFTPLTEFKQFLIEGDLKIKFPNDRGLDYSELTPILIFNNTLFTPDKFQRISMDEIVIHPYIMPLVNAKVEREVSTENPLRGTCIYKNDVSLHDYFLESSKGKRDDECCIILLKTKELFLDKKDVKRDFDDKTIFLSNKINGILVEKATKRIIDFTSVKYGEKNNLFLERKEELFTYCEDNHSGFITIETPHYGVEKEFSSNRANSDYEMIYLSH